MAALVLAGCQPSAATDAVAAPPPPTLPVLRLDTTTATTFHDYPAALQGRTTVEIRPQVEGYLDKVFVDEGATVRAGQPLFHINDRPYHEQLNTALGGLHAAQAALTNARLDVDKYRPLVANRVVAPIQLQTAQGNYQAARATVEQARAAVAAARVSLGFSLIKAPVSGLLGRLPKRLGSLVGRTDAEPLTVLADVGEVYAYFSLSEQDFLRFQAAYPGATLAAKLRGLPPVALLLPDGRPYPHPGRVRVVEGQVDKNTAAIGLRATFPNPEGLLRAGGTGRVRLTRRESGALLVPQAATFELQDKTFVYVLGDSNRVRQTPIEVRGSSGPSFLVEGLRPGQRIVTNGLSQLQDGQRITPTSSGPRP